jgi:predicted DNA-binding transcriptional regulator AlpA
MSIEHSPAPGGRKTLRRQQVLERFGISNSTLNNWIKAGRFPAPIELGPNVRAWLEEELDAVVERSVRQRDAAA